MNEIGVSIITPTIREENLQTIIDNYQRQKIKLKELIIIINNDSIEISAYKEKCESLPEVTVYQVPQEKSLGGCLNIGIKRAKYDYIARFDDDDYYGPNYFVEAMEAFDKYGCDIVTKSSTLCYYKEIGLLIQRGAGRQYQFGRLAGGATMIFKKSIWEKNRFPEINRAEDSRMIRDCIKKGGVVYSTSEYNFMVNRTVSGKHHTNTWSLEKFEQTAGVRRIAENISYEEAIAIVNRVLTEEEEEAKADFSD